MGAIQYNVTIFITFKIPNVGAMHGYVACSWHCKHLSSLFFIILTIDGGVMAAVSCCTALSFSSSNIASLSVCSPFSYMWVAKL